MGTRADFYIGTGPTAEWIGSISYDGYPDGRPSKLVMATSEAAFRAEVEVLLADTESLTTRPEEGWPWPWKDSRTTDYAYAWCTDGVRLSDFGGHWETMAEHAQRRAEDRGSTTMADTEVRDMTSHKMGKDKMLDKSGLIILISGG